MLLFRNHATGAKVLVKAAVINAQTLGQPNLGIDMRKLVVPNAIAKRAGKAHAALWHDRVPSELRAKIIDHHQRRALGEGNFHRNASELAGHILSRPDLRKKLKRKLLKIVFDNAPISSPSVDTTSAPAGAPTGGGQKLAKIWPTF